LQGQKAGNLAGVASKGIATTAIKAAGAGASEISSILEQRIMGHTRYSIPQTFTGLPLLLLFLNR